MLFNITGYFSTVLSCFEKTTPFIRFTGKRLLFDIIGKAIKKRQAYKPDSVF